MLRLATRVLLLIVLCHQCEGDNLGAHCSRVSVDADADWILYQRSRRRRTSFRRRRRRTSFRRRQSQSQKPLSPQGRSSEGLAVPQKAPGPGRQRTSFRRRRTSSRRRRTSSRRRRTSFRRRRTSFRRRRTSSRRRRTSFRRRRTSFRRRRTSDRRRRTDFRRRRTDFRRRRSEQERRLPSSGAEEKDVKKSRKNTYMIMVVFLGVILNLGFFWWKAAAKQAVRGQLNRGIVHTCFAATIVHSILVFLPLFLLPFHMVSKDTGLPWAAHFTYLAVLVVATPFFSFGARGYRPTNKRMVLMTFAIPILLWNAFAMLCAVTIECVGTFGTQNWWKVGDVIIIISYTCICCVCSCCYCASAQEVKFSKDTFRVFVLGSPGIGKSTVLKNLGGSPVCTEGESAQVMVEQMQVVSISRAKDPCELLGNKDVRWQALDLTDLPCPDLEHQIAVDKSLRAFDGGWHGAIIMDVLSARADDNATKSINWIELSFNHIGKWDNVIYCGTKADQILEDGKNPQQVLDAKVGLINENMSAHFDQGQMIKHACFVSSDDISELKQKLQDVVMTKESLGKMRSKSEMRSKSKMQRKSIFKTEGDEDTTKYFPTSSCFDKSPYSHFDEPMTGPCKQIDLEWQHLSLPFGAKRATLAAEYYNYCMLILKPADQYLDAMSVAIAIRTGYSKAHLMCGVFLSGLVLQPLLAAITLDFLAVMTVTLSMDFRTMGKQKAASTDIIIFVTEQLPSIFLQLDMIREIQNDSVAVCISLAVSIFFAGKALITALDNLSLLEAMVPVPSDPEEGAYEAVREEVDRKTSLEPMGKPAE